MAKAPTTAAKAKRSAAKRTTSEAEVRQAGLPVTDIPEGAPSATAAPPGDVAADRFVGTAGSVSAAGSAKEGGAEAGKGGEVGAGPASDPVTNTDPDAGAQVAGSRPAAAADGRGGGAGSTAASPPDPSDVAERDYAVLSPLKWERRRREIGATVRMTEAEAETLVAIGVLGEGG